MAYAYLLDTNIISDMLRHPNGPIFQKISDVGESSICTSIVVACELNFGVQKKGSIALRQRLKDVLQIIPVIPLLPPVEKHYGEIRAFLEQEGMPIGPNDLMIAAHALSLSLTVITANMREFSRVPALKVENWLET